MDVDFEVLRKNLDDYCDHVYNCANCPLVSLEACDFLDRSSDSDEYDIPNDIILQSYQTLEELDLVEIVLNKLDFKPMDHVDFSDLFGVT